MGASCFKDQSSSIKYDFIAIFFLHNFFSRRDRLISRTINGDGWFSSAGGVVDFEGVDWGVLDVVLFGSIGL